jgi:hypothetical protein
MCTGTIIQFKIPRVVVGEARTFEGEFELLRSRGVEVVVLDDQRCVDMMRSFQVKNGAVGGGHRRGGLVLQMHVPETKPSSTSVMARNSLDPSESVPTMETERSGNGNPGKC